MRAPKRGRKKAPAPLKVLKNSPWKNHTKRWY